MGGCRVWLGVLSRVWLGGCGVWVDVGCGGVC